MEREPFGIEGVTTEDLAFTGSRFAEVRQAIFAEPYQPVWGGASAPPLPVYPVTLGSVLRGVLPFGRAYPFLAAARRTVASHADLRWGPDRKGFRRLLHPNAVCLTGTWEITADTPYSGYFRRGARGLVVGRYSTCCTETRRGDTRSLALVGRIYPTTDPEHPERLPTASFITQEDFGGERSESINQAVLRNAPDTHGWRRGSGLPTFLVTGAVLLITDSQPTIRQVYQIAELGKPPGEPTRAPEFLQLTVDPAQPVVPGERLDFRDEVMGQIYDAGDPAPRRRLVFRIATSDHGKTRGTGLYQRRIIEDWREIGTLSFDAAVASYNGDHVLNFNHPAWRRDRNDPASVKRKRWRRKAATVVAAAAFALLSACSPLKQYRTVTTVQSPDTGSYRDEMCAERAPNSSSDLCALEHRTYTYQGAEHDYYFATVEFDDRGWFWDRRQMEVLLRFLYEHRDAQGDPEEYLIFTHAHGWQHRADACDNNVVCFQRLLERLDVSERGFQRGKPRKIVGIFVAWRGRSIDVPKISATSFYSRKRAGNRVGIGGVSELLARLNDFRSLKNYSHEGDKTQLVISGHSFGGQVIYKALAQPLIERAAKMEDRARVRPGSGTGYGYDVAHSFGDLVILVNPAFEGAAFESLQFAATNRCYPANQRPAMMVVTSTADDATRVAFPAGRAFSNALSRSRCRDQRKSIFHTVGHLDRYRTHTLRLAGMAPGESKPPERDEGPCGCPYLGPIEEYQAEARDEQFFEQMKVVEDERKSRDGMVHEMAAGGDDGDFTSVEDYRETTYGLDAQGHEMVLDRAPDYAANYPYLVISTNADFIPSHSAIYGERFTDFLRRFYFRHLVEHLNFPEQCFDNPNPECLESDITPCGRSWTARTQYGFGGGGRSDKSCPELDE